MFTALVGFCCFRLCSLTFRVMLSRIRPAKKQEKRKLNPQEKKVHKILSNQNAREILKSRAITAINSQVNRSRRGYSSQYSLDSVCTVPDLTERVIRVSFAPEPSASEPTATESRTPSLNPVPEARAQEDQTSLSEGSIGVESNPPAYDTLSTHSRVSASEPPPEYSTLQDSQSKESSTLQDEK